MQAGIILFSTFVSTTTLELRIEFLGKRHLQRIQTRYM